MLNMEIKSIFDSSKYRNILLEILSYLTYDQILNLLFLNQQTRKYLKEDFLSSEGNQFILSPIVKRRFFDRSNCSFYFNDSFLQPKSSITNEKKFWKYYYPKIQDGDIIYVKNCDKFIHIYSSQIFVGYQFDPSIPSELLFPIEYWKEVGKNYPFRCWINVKVYYESLNNWMNNPTIRFIDIDLNPDLYGNNSPIEICFTYVDELIYIYKGR
jgi:hypothetical protein